MASFSRRRFAIATAATALATRTASAQSTPDSSPAASPVAAPTGAPVIKIGFLPIMIYAPMYVALEKGYYAENGLDVQPTPMASGTDLTVAVATDKLHFALTGVGPAFWNGVSSGMPLKIVAPGHEEGKPVATPLMAAANGSIGKVQDLKGKKVAVNAPGATEYWLNAALGTGDLTIDDVDLQYLAFPDAVAALTSGALDAAMIGEPLATTKSGDGSLKILTNDFAVQNTQVTAVFGNEVWLGANRDHAVAFIAGYLRACDDLNTNFNDAANLAIVSKYTNVPAEAINNAIKPLYRPEGTVQSDNLVKLQQFFIDRGLMDFDEPIDPKPLVATDLITEAVSKNGK